MESAPLITGPEIASSTYTVKSIQGRRRVANGVQTLLVREHDFGGLASENVQDKI